MREQKEIYVVVVIVSQQQQQHYYPAVVDPSSSWARRYCLEVLFYVTYCDQEYHYEA